MAVDSKAEPHVGKAPGTVPRCPNPARSGYFLTKVGKCCAPARPDTAPPNRSGDGFPPPRGLFSTAPFFPTDLPPTQAWVPRGLDGWGPGSAQHLEPPKGTSARRRVESRVNQPLQALGVSYGRGRDQGGASPGPAHRASGAGLGAGRREERRGRARGSLKRAGPGLPQTQGSPRPSRSNRRPQAPPAHHPSLPGAVESSRPRGQLLDMATPTGPPVSCPKAAVARALLLGWVLVQVAGATGEWHPPLEALGRSTGRRGNSPAWQWLTPLPQDPRGPAGTSASGFEALALSLGKELPREPPP